MPSGSDLLRTAIPLTAATLFARRGTGNATRRLTTGVDNASGRITQTGEDLRKLYLDTLTGQQRKLQPYEDVGAQNLNTLNTNLQTPREKFSFTGADLLNEPGYQFGLDQGVRGLDAKRRALGISQSGGEQKELTKYGIDYAGTKFNEGFNRGLQTYNTNQQVEQDRLNRIKGLVDVGANATNTDVNAQGDMASRSGTSALVTGQQLADLMTQRAEAEAAGELGKANAISQAIQQWLSQITSQDQLNQILGNDASGKVAAYLKQNPSGYMPPGGSAITAPAVPSVTGGAAPGFFPKMTGADLLSTGAGVGGAAATGASLLGGAAPFVMPAAAPLGATGALAAPSIAAPALAPGAVGGGGLGASTAALLTNPITIGVGAAIAAAIIWKKSQVHPTATKFVDTYQKPFEQHLRGIVNGFDAAYASGSLDKASAQQLRDQTAQFIQGFDADIAKFRTQGGKERTVADQAKATMTQNFGANWEKILSKMDSEIAGLR